MSRPCKTVDNEVTSIALATEGPFYTDSFRYHLWGLSGCSAWISTHPHAVGQLELPGVVEHGQGELLAVG